MTVEMAQMPTQSCSPEMWLPVSHEPVRWGQLGRVALLGAEGSQVLVSLFLQTSPSFPSVVTKGAGHRPVSRKKKGASSGASGFPGVLPSVSLVLPELRTPLALSLLGRHLPAARRRGTPGPSLVATLTGMGRALGWSCPSHRSPLRVGPPSERAGWTW